MMEIIKCKCGYYKQLNDELCPNCGADYSRGDEYEILENQDSAQMRWMNLGEKGFNEYMKSIEQPIYMLCPQCRFKMLITETRCPRCDIPVKFKGFKNNNMSLPERFGMWATKYLMWYYFIAIIAAVAVIIFFVLIFIGALL